MDRRHLQRGLLRQWRQDADQPLGEHRLAGSGRPDHRKVVSAGGGDLDREPGLWLTDDVGHVVGCAITPLTRGRHVRQRRERPPLVHTLVALDDLGQG